MSSKRALVVDDSKSARTFLSRILERHEIAVDAADSAEAAIDYLTRNKPDVIFMDHLMPGMDGFQAVQTIKNNPRTSSIPILMYTSQEGDLYLGQARALGAEGVLPKQIKQSDVTRMLFQLRLVSDRRSGDRDQTTFSALANAPDLVPANESAIIVEAPAEAAAPAAAEAVAISSHSAEALAELLPKMSLEIRAAVDASLQKELAALRTFIGGSMSSHTERLHGDLAALLPAPRTPDLDMPTMIAERRVGPRIGWTLAVLGIAGAAVMSWMWWGRGGEIVALNTDLKAAYEELETLRARPVAVAPPVEVAPVVPVDPNVVLPAPDAPDAAAASAQGVDLVPTGASIAPPASQTVAPAASTAGPATAAPAGAAPAPAAPATAMPTGAMPPAAAKAAPAAAVPALAPATAAPTQAQ